MAPRRLSRTPGADAALGATAELNGAHGQNCVFCSIVAGTSPASWVRNEPGSDLVVFRNRLNWAAVMLLVVPRAHMTQEEMWSSDMIARAGRLAIEVGDEHCPDGYRLLSNFGRWGHQSQEHAHLHVISGLAGNLSAAEPVGEALAECGIDLRRMRVDRVPDALLLVKLGVKSQRQFWSGDGLLDASRVAVRRGTEGSIDGFRLASNVGAHDEDQPGLFLLSGGQLDLYV